MFELTQIQTSVASKHVQGWCYSLAPSDWNSHRILFCSYFYQQRGTPFFVCLPLCQDTCNFCPSMNRVVRILLVSSSTSVSQHISPSLVHFKLSEASTVQIILFLLHGHIGIRVKSNSYRSWEVFPLTVSHECLLQTQRGSLWRSLDPSAKPDLHIMHPIPIVHFIIHSKASKPCVSLLSPVKKTFHPGNSIILNELNSHSLVAFASFEFSIHSTTALPSAPFWLCIHQIYRSYNSSLPS